MRAATAALLTAGLALACGYQIVSGTRVFGQDVQQLEIQMFENRSDEPGLEWMIGEALMEEFLRRGQLHTVHSGETTTSQVVLRGVVQQVAVRPSAFSSVAISVEDSIEVTVDVNLRRVDTGDVVWQRVGLVAREQFLSSPDPLVHETNKEMALLRVSTLIAESVHDGLFRY
ncbi:MAG: LPS assembly lipoprotein LptE [Myxococcota bacterium]